MKTAEKIKIIDELKTDFIQDEFGNPTEEEYSYYEYHILDDDDEILEIGRYWGYEKPEVNDILSSTGIKFGISQWF